MAPAVDHVRLHASQRRAERRSMRSQLRFPSPSNSTMRVARQSPAISNRPASLRGPPGRSDVRRRQRAALRGELGRDAPRLQRRVERGQPGGQPVASTEAEISTRRSVRRSRMRSEEAVCRPRAPERRRGAATRTSSSAIGRGWAQASVDDVEGETGVLGQALDQAIPERRCRREESRTRLGRRSIDQ